MASVAAATARARTIDQCHIDGDMKTLMTAAAERAVSIPHLSFATDLLFNFDAVRAHSAQGIATQQSVIQLLKSRIVLERTYANELSRMAQQSQVDELEHGSLRLALGSLRAQYVNSSVQHRALANSLEDDVLKPIEDMYMRQNHKVHDLLKRVNTIKKKAKACEDVYKKDYTTFDKQFREASVTFAAAMDAGFSSTLIDIQYRKQLSQEPTAVVSTAETDGRLVQKSAVAIQALNNNSQKLVNWLLSSDQGKKENLCASTVRLLEIAELSRRKCQQSWLQVEQSRVGVYRDLQSILTDFQDMAEQRITKIATSLRKHVVFESSALANEQYDWQMIAGRIENVDNEGDIRDFILSHRLHDLPSMTVNDLCCAFEGGMVVTSPSLKPSRPLKPFMLEISDLAARRIPFDRIGNQSPLSKLLVTRKQSTMAYADVHPAEKVTDGSQLPPSDEREAFSVQFDQLKIICNEDTPSTSSSTSPCNMMASSQRICFAKDVAQAINKAHTVHVEQKTVTLAKAIFPATRSEPEDCGLEANCNPTEPRPESETSSCLQSNDVEEDEGFGENASEKDPGVI